jgi:hypothetical protein
MFDIPTGGLSDTPLLVNLLDAIHLSGPFGKFRDRCGGDPARRWMVDHPAVSFPSSYKSLQSAALHALATEQQVTDMYSELHKKAKITLQPIAPFSIPVQWYDELKQCLKYVKPYIKLCWLKTVCGAWCTASRLSTLENRPCIFGCEGVRDELCHYLQCPILWQLALEAIRIHEVSIMILSRICVSEPSIDKLKLLAFCHALYHCCAKDTQCIREDGMPYAPLIVQSRAYEFSSYCLHLVGGS